MKQKILLALSLCIIVTLASAKVRIGAKAQVNHFLVTLVDGSQFNVDLPLGQKPAIPLKVVDKTTGNTVKYSGKDVVSMELSTANSPIDGCRRWEVRRVATPSLIQGLKNTDLRLLGVVKADGEKRVYRWTVKKPNQDEKDFSGIWYGVALEADEVVYAFIQDGKVWFRDMQLILGKTHRDFVKAANAYYVSGKKSVIDERQAQLKKNPEKILEL